MLHLIYLLWDYLGLGGREMKAQSVYNHEHVWALLIIQ